MTAWSILVWFNHSLVIRSAARCRVHSRRVFLEQRQARCLCYKIVMTGVQSP
jgi:hypothetical protein